MGDLKTSPELKYCTDIFATDPIPHQTTYHLEKKTLAEKKSPLHVLCLEQMLNYLHFIMAKYAKNKNYVHSSKG